MFICSLCNTQSKPGEKPVVLPTTLRRVVYEHESGLVTEGTEWASSAPQCESCAFTVLARVIPGTKTVLVPCSHERTQRDSLIEHFEYVPVEGVE